MDLDVNYIKDIIEGILQNTFNNEIKSKVLVKHDSLLFACPICGDSQKNIYKKRAKLFFNNLKMFCYNDGCRSSLTMLCRSNNINIDPDKKMKIFEYLDAQISYTNTKSDDYILENLDLAIDKDILLNVFNTGKSFLVDFKPVEYNSKVYKYMVNDRNLNQKIVQTHMYQAKYRLTDRYYEDVVVFLNCYKNKVFGLQFRNLKSDKKRLFKIYQFSELYEKIYGEHPDETISIPYNKLGFFFNVFNVNYENVITIFEGYIDSILMRNTVGAVGTNTDMNFFFNPDIKRRFFFDNDAAGHKKSQEFIRKGESVFLWEKFFNDFAKKNSDFYKNIQALRDIKDLNRLCIIANTQDPEKDLNINNYFSKDKYDIIWIPVAKTVKKEDKINSKYVIDYNWSDIKNTLLL